MSEVYVMDHPLIQHKIATYPENRGGYKRIPGGCQRDRRSECYEATRDLKLQDVKIKTPLCEMVGKELTGKKLAVVPIFVRVLEWWTDLYP